MMGWYHDGAVGWAGWLLMTAVMVAFWAVVVFALVALFRGTASGQSRRTPDQILDERFARGEIDEAEYRARLEVLHNTSRPPVGKA